MHRALRYHKARCKNFLKEFSAIASSSELPRFTASHHKTPQGQQHNLTGENSQEHRQRIHRGIGNRRRVLFGNRVGIRQRRRIGCCTRQKSDNQMVVHLELDASDDTRDDERNDRDNQTQRHVKQAVAIDEGADKSIARAQADARQKERNAHFAKHQVGRMSRVGSKQPATNVAGFATITFVMSH